MSRRALLLAALVLALGACAPRPTAPPAPDAPAPVPAGAVAHELDTRSSWLQVRVYRAGRLARLGHNHLVASSALRGRVLERPGRVELELVLAVADLRVDDPTLRAAAGPDFAAQPDAAAIAGTRRNLLGPAVLDAARYPLIRVHGVLPEGAAQATAVIELRGERRELPVPLRLQRHGDRLVAEGRVRWRHADLGLTPFSVLGGAIRVAEELDLAFRFETLPR